ncbi:hypothetical protein E2542_SST00893 [Spatholobus suberectus]|nr:hypothetical protein E2542_SST00893 [Spatholobus suberectus]
MRRQWCRRPWRPCAASLSRFHRALMLLPRIECNQGSRTRFTVSRKNIGDLVKRDESKSLPPRKAAAEKRENGPVLALAMVAMKAWSNLQRHTRAGMEEMLRLFDCTRQCDAEIDSMVMAHDGGNAAWEKLFAGPMELQRSWKCDCGLCAMGL